MKGVFGGFVKAVARTIIRGSWKPGRGGGRHITRYSMYKRLAQVSGVLPVSPGQRVLSISHSDVLCHEMGLDGLSIVTADYPEFNVLNLALPDQSFDYVVSDQVLEHVEGSPQQAVDEMFRVLRPGGFGIHTTCFMNPIHGCPGDFWRFTPAALELLCRHHGEIVELGGWGNYYVWIPVVAGLRYEPVLESRRSPLRWIATHNSSRWLVSTWIIVRKTAALPGS